MKAGGPTWASGTWEIKGRVEEDWCVRRRAEVGGGERAVLGFICSLKPNPWSCWPPNVKFTLLPSCLPGMGEPGGLQSVGSHRVGHNWRDLAAAAATWYRHQPGVGIHRKPCCLMWGLEVCRSTSPALGQAWKGDWPWQRAYLNVSLFCFCKLLPFH